MPGFNPVFGGGMYCGSDQLLQSIARMGMYSMLGMGSMGMAGMAGLLLGGMTANLMAGVFNKGMLGMVGIKPNQQLHGGMGGLKVEGNSVTTPGGYKITYQGTDVIISGMGKVGGGSFALATAGPGGAFAVAGQLPGYETKGQTKIWGDPHVDQSDGKRWDWKDKTMTFNLPDGTKITMNADGPKGVVRSIDIYNGHDHIHGDGGSIKSSSYDGYMADAMQADGDSVFAVNNDVSNWYQNPFGLGPTVGQIYGAH